MNLNVLLIIGLSIIAWFFFAGPLKLWIQAQVVQTPIPFFQILKLRFADKNYATLINQYIIVKKAGMDITLSRLAEHSRQGGSVPRVVLAGLGGYKGDMQTPFEEIAACDLAGEDVVEKMNTAVLTGKKDWNS